MINSLQQQVFALDAYYNAQKVPKNSRFKTLYIRRRSQLLRETNKSPEQWKQYLKLRSALLELYYGKSKWDCSSTSSSFQQINAIIESQPRSPLHKFDGLLPSREAKASKAIVGGNSLAEHYAFRGVHHVFDQHSKAVTMVKFAHNDKSKLCCCSVDGNLSLCHVASEPPCVIGILKGHKKAVTGFDWSANNDMIASGSIDSTLKIWELDNFQCLRTFNEPNRAEILCCIFQPSNNNLILIGNNRGELRVVNVSIGLFLKNVCKIGGTILSLTCDASGKNLWAGNDKGEIVSVVSELDGSLSKIKKLNIGKDVCITSLSYRAWMSREARDPLLLVNATNDSVYLFNITNQSNDLQLRRRFPNRHRKYIVRSIFCPIMSFREGACIVTSSEDGNVYFVDVEKSGTKAFINILQGHSTTVFSISFNYDESLLATSDQDGLVIIWKRNCKNLNNIE